MKALSIGLIKGKIDEIDQIVDIEWVQPRTLDKAQISALNDRLSSWKDNVAQLSQTLQKQVAIATV